MFDTSKIPLEIYNFLKENKGFFLVGGCLRDLMIGRMPKDWDIVTTSPELMEKFNCIKIGKAFPVWQLKIGDYIVEVAAARKEKKVGKGHKGFECELTNSLDEDLLRRDLTINAFAYGLDESNTFHLFHAPKSLYDFRNKILRHVTDAFSEDPLRVFRVARFAAQLGFTVHKSTIHKMNKLKDELVTLPADRVRNELEKSLLAPYPHKFFEVLKEADCLDYWFKEVASLVGIEQGEVKHPEGDVFNHTMLCLQELKEKTLHKMLCVLGHDFGKAYTDPTQWPHHYNHEQLAIIPINHFCERLGYGSGVRRSMQVVARHHMNMHHIKELRPKTLLEILLNTRRINIGVEGFGKVCMADTNGRNILRKTYDKLDYLIGADNALKSVTINPGWTKVVIEQERVIALKKYRETYNGNAL